MYADRNTSKANFWKSCAEYIQSEMGKTYRHIDRVVAKWEKSRRHEVEEAKESGVAKSDTDWLQAMDVLIEFIDGFKMDESERKNSKEAEMDARRIAQREQSRMAIRISERKRALEEDEDVIEIEGPLEATTGVSTLGDALPQPPHPPQPPQPSQPSQPSNKRKKSQAKGVKEAEEYGKYLSSALQSFCSTFAREMGSVMKEAVSNPMNKVRDEIQELKEGQRRLMSEIQTDKQDNQRLMLEIPREIRGR
jgi:hypothetical protein